jgi:transposase
MRSEEQTTLEQLARSRTAEARLVQRAQILLGLCDGDNRSTVARRLGVTRPTVYAWVARFNDTHGRVAGPAVSWPSADLYVPAARRSDRRRTDQTGGTRLALGSWTLDRLQDCLNEYKGIAIKRSRIDETLLDEGLRWRKQETWFGERVDPDFAQKRG